MSATSVKGTSPIVEFVFEIRGGGSIAIDIAFYKVPQMAFAAIGDIVVDWGDGTTEKVDCILSDTELEAMAIEPTFTALSYCGHLYDSDTPKTVRIGSSSGFLPLRALPRQTTRILSPLPTLTLGETSSAATLIASPIVHTLVPVDDQGRSNLESIPEDLFVNNPQLCVFEETFLGSQIQRLSASLFAGQQRLVSLHRTFANSELLAIEKGALAKSDSSSILQETFAGCRELETVDDPFAGNAVPILADALFEGVNPKLFSWCNRERREQLGWIRPHALLSDPCCSFDWRADRIGVAEDVIVFYPMDLNLSGDLCIEWGDGVTETIDWAQRSTIQHTWEDTKIHHVKMHYCAGEEVPPFRFGISLIRILTPLPPMHPRCVSDVGDFCGWAADHRQLVELPSELFKNNPNIVNLEQAFAGCVRLRHAPDDLLTGLPHLCHIDSMFAFCNSLPALPESYALRKRDTAMDYFVPFKEAD